MALLLYQVKLTTSGGLRKDGRMVVAPSDDVRATAEQMLVEEGIEGRIEELRFLREM